MHITLCWGEEARLKFIGTIESILKVLFCLLTFAFVLWFIFCIANTDPHCIIFDPECTVNYTLLLNK